MPKQLIPSADYGRTVPVDHPNDGPTTFVELDRDMVKVGWDKQRGLVQLAVLQSFEGELIEHGFELDDELADGMDPRLAESLKPHYINLDRAGINQLIVTLRKARDDAYGKDA